MNLSFVEEGMVVLLALSSLAEMGYYCPQVMPGTSAGHLAVPDGCSPQYTADAAMPFHSPCWSGRGHPSACGVRLNALLPAGTIITGSPHNSRHVHRQRCGVRVAHRQ